MSNYGPVSTSVDGQFERRCANCGKRFRTDYPHQRYCSNRCKRSPQAGHRCNALCRQVDRLRASRAESALKEVSDE